MPDFSAAAIKFGPWSTSKAQLAMRCSFGFRAKYVHKVKGKALPTSSPARIGKAAHAALEWVLSGRYELKESLLKAALNHMLTTNEMDDLFAMSYNMNGFMKRMEKFKADKNVVDQQVELRFGLTQDFRPTKFFGKDVFFRGVWDLVFLSDTPNIGKYLIVIDHKSGEPQDDISKYLAQLNTYSLAGIFLYPDVRGIQTALNYILADRLTWAGARSLDSIRAELIPWFVEFINQAGAAAEVEIARKGWWCAYCDHTQHCPLKKL